MSTPDNHNGLISGRYQLQGKLGEGGMGSAFRALDRMTGRSVALKRLDQRAAKFCALFEREYHTLASLRHPCVIEVYDFGIGDDGLRFYTMELLEGDDISQLSPLPWRAACQHLRDIATSLALLHARKLVHRDVSPRNVRIARDGRAKLLDFGTVTPFGRAADVAGTPASMAPEVLRGLELDARADLFSLGVVAYWALAGHRPYLVSRLTDAEVAWRTKPRPLSEVAPDIPRALEQLVFSLLSIDPIGRPASAAELIARLVAIADLDDEPLEGLTHSHLSSCVLIGRERETAQFTQHFERASRGQGSTVLIEGAAGTGKSRLAAEMTIRASLLGLATLRIDALEHPDPSGLVGALIARLMEIVPAEAAETLPAHGVLFQAFPHLREFAVAPALSKPLPRDPLEQRAVIHNTLAAWLVDVAIRRPIVISIDNAHAADLASAAALITIAHTCPRARIVFVATLLRGAAAPVAVQQLTRIGSRVRLRHLPPEAMAELVRSVFGDVPHLSRLTSWIQATSAGVPGQALELLSVLIDREVIRYAGGAWVLPAQLSETDLPQTVDQALSTRLEQLDSNATRLARLLALHHAPAALTLCQQLLQDLSPSDLFSALNQLVSHQVLVGSGDSYRIRNEGLRTLLVQSLEKSELEKLHHALGSAILAGLPAHVPANPRTADSVHELALALQAGFHLLQAGEGDRARHILREAGFALAYRGDGFADAVPALQAALTEYERLGHSRYERAYLRVPLTLAGLYLDWRLAYQHGEPLIELYSQTTGLTLALRLRRWLGRPLALGVSLVVAYIASIATQRRRAAKDFREQIMGLIAVASPVLGNCSALAEGQRARAVLRHLEPLSWFPRSHMLRVIHAFYCALAEVAAGSYAEGLARSRQVLERLRQPIAGMPRDGHVQLESGVLLCVGSLEVFRTDGSVHNTLEALGRSPTWTARQSAAGIRANYHAGRGERAQYEACREELDVVAAQTGSTWRQDVLMPRSDWWYAALCEDVLGLKRAARKLEELAQEHPTLTSTFEAAQACYLLERGRAADALARHGAALEAELREPSLYGMRFVATFARVARAAGQPARARDACEAALARMTAADREFTGLVHFVELELALSRAELGERERAAADLDRLIEAQSKHDNALIHGLTHRARAQVALLERDANTFARHLSAMEQWFVRTNNTTLIAQHQRFADEGRRSGLIDVKVATRPPRARQKHVHVRRAFTERRGPGERLQLAIDLVVEKSGAADGYLYLLEPSGLRFAAPLAGAEPPASLLVELAARVEQHGAAHAQPTNDDVASPAALVTVVESGEENLLRHVQPGVTYSYVLLTLQRPENLVIVGAIALVPGAEPTIPIDCTYLEEVARGIYDAGDVQTVYFESRGERAS
ncbi:MAG TPA: protein kinase [Polyangiales bacterium]|nr:protein kinase [Polyangiales bacterium]